MSGMDLGTFRAVTADLPDDTEVVYEGDVDNRWERYSLSAIYVADGRVVMS